MLGAPSPSRHSPGSQAALCRIFGAAIENRSRCVVALIFIVVFKALPEERVESLVGFAL